MKKRTANKKIKQHSPKQKTNQTEKILLRVLVRPLLSVIWGFASTSFIFSIIYSLCYYPARDVCTTPYEWVSILPVYQKLLIMSFGLPTFIADTVLRQFTSISFSVIEIWWSTLLLSSIGIAFVIISCCSHLILHTRKHAST